MKVQFVHRDDTGSIVERGYVYDVVSTECGWYRIVDKFGDDGLYPPSMFEIIEKYPIPPETFPVKESEIVY